MLGTYLALKRAKAVLATPRVQSICKIWEISTGISLDSDGVVEVSFKQEGYWLALLRSEPGIMPWLIVRVPSQYGPRTVLATGSVREAAAAILTLLETAKK
jgi:hypothetical protein